MNTSNAPLVTVLTPAYNEAKYLAQAIESVLGQTYTNWEYVIVDNCSKDATLEVARRYAQQDRRIRLLRNETLLSQAKNFNFTVQQISPASKYAKFVQGDDYIYPQCLEEMVKLVEEHPNVGIVSSYRLDGGKVKGDGLPLPCRVISGREVCRKHFNEPIFLFGTPTTVMFRSEILRSRTPFFNEACLHFDTEACFEFLEKWDFGFIHQVLSFSRTDNISITSALMRFDPDAIDHLITLRKYGPKYLTADEFAAKWQEEEAIFYDLLARAVLNRKGPEYWKYQCDGLRVAGCELKRTKLWKHVGLILLNRIGNPVASFQNWRSRNNMGSQGLGR